nr:MAG TPA: hypothetical protein [Caudoviricetes sp.]
MCLFVMTFWHRCYAAMCLKIWAPLCIGLAPLYCNMYTLPFVCISKNWALLHL